MWVDTSTRRPWSSIRPFKIKLKLQPVAFENSLYIKYHSFFQGGSGMKKKRPRVYFFAKASSAGLTNLHNQEYCIISSLLLALFPVTGGLTSHQFHGSNPTHWGDTRQSKIRHVVTHWVSQPTCLHLTGTEILLWH